MSSHTLAFVESPVQLLNVLEWAHAQGLSRAARAPRDSRGAGDARGIRALRDDASAP
ncbi:hypothetical protein GTY23_42140, partial [Streptomyces sp. SID5998]|nr:hypothetical protein [Streptomyces sp. SID5998]